VELSDWQAILTTRCSIIPDGLLVIGVSGGPDSLCLLDILNRLNQPIVVAHFNHHLRAESSADAAFVETFAQMLGLRYSLGERDVRALAIQNSLSIEEAARKARYSFLFEIARRFCAHAVAVAHTADDQVETVLMHILAGSGITGLQGMAYRVIVPEWDDRIPLIRPLLGMWRKDVEVYCRERLLHPVDDHSNLDTTFLRNRIRHELIPNMEQYNPKVKLALWRMAHNVTDDYEVLKNMGEQTWDQCILRQEEKRMVFSYPKFSGIKPGLQRLILMWAVQQLGIPTREFGFVQTENAIRFINGPSRSRRLKLAAGVCLTLNADELEIALDLLTPCPTNWPQMDPGQVIVITVPGAFHLTPEWQLTCTQTTAPVVLPAPGEDDPFHAWLDADSLDSPLSMRAQHPGDRFHPLGMHGHKMKLSDFWINEELPFKARAGWPLLFCGDRIAWIPGFRPADPYRLTSGTQRVIEFHLYKKSMD
jgi:tRNA(Ile)-lysidine synthase